MAPVFLDVVLIVLGTGSDKDGSGSTGVVSRSVPRYIHPPVNITRRVECRVHYLCDFVYADFKNNFTNPVWFASRTIVTPTNEAAQFVNDSLLTRIPNELKIYRSSDTVDSETLYPIEFVNKLIPSGFPPHILKLEKK
uniref:Uncharacterized protein n=1 Tax=Octopus bimaculoides TaxID=37653 RepID=A0A0L8GZ45_OCTBM